MTLALHGNLGSAADFGFLRARAEAVDLWALTHLSLEEAAERLRRRVTPSHGRRGLVGYSMGGRLALQALADAPEFWDFAVILSAHPGLSSSVERERRREHDLGWSEKVRRLPWKDFFARWDRQPVFDERAAPHRESLRELRERIALGFENWSLGCQRDLREPLRRADLPVVWLVGQRDAKFRELGEEMAGILPRCEFAVVPHCGHRLLHEAPDSVINALDRAEAAVS